MALEKKETEELAQQFMAFCNDYSPDIKLFVSIVCNSHRTLQQTAGRVMCGLIHKWAEDYKTGNYDLRSKDVTFLCRQIVDNFEDKMYLALV